MADPKKSPEIVTEQEIEAVVKNASFDTSTFLKLYNEWKVTKNSGTFAALRTMHENAGYNNKNNIFGAEQEMHEIAAIVQRFHDKKIQVTINTAQATAATAWAVNQTAWAPGVVGALGPSVEVLKPQELKAKLDTRLKAPISGPDLLADLEILREINDPVGRMYTINWIVGSMIKDGFEITNIWWKIDIISSDPKNQVKIQKAAELERALLTSIESKSISRAEVSQAILIWSGDKWATYVKTTAAWAQISTDGYTKFILESYNITWNSPQDILSKVQANKNIPPRERAYLYSSLQWWMKELDLTKTTQTYNTWVQAGIDLFSSQAYQAIAKVTGGSVPKTPEEAKKMAEQVAANPANATDASGKPISWLLGGILAIFGLGYSKSDGFSFWTGLKRAFIWVIAVVGGCAIGKEWKKELGFDLCDEAKKMMKDAFGKGKEAVNDGINAAKKTVKWDTNKKWSKDSSDSADAEPDSKKNKKNESLESKDLNASQKIAVSRVENDENIKKALEKATPWKSEYINFIHSQLSTIPIEKLITNDEKSIFAPWRLLDPSIQSKLWKLEPNTLKKILRVYLGSSARFSETSDDKDPGKKEKLAFLSELEKKWISSDKFASMDLKKLTTVLYTDWSNDNEKKIQESMNKIANYVIKYEWKDIPKDNLDIKIAEAEEGGFIVEVKIKDPKKINIAITQIKPLTIEFDDNGKLETWELSMHAMTELWARVKNITLTQEGNSIVLKNK